MQALFALGGNREQKDAAQKGEICPLGQGLENIFTRPQPAVVKQRHSRAKRRADIALSIKGRRRALQLACTVA